MGNLVKNMKIRTKLLLSFLIVAFVALIVGCVGTFGMLSLNKNEGVLYREGVESLTGVNGMYAVIVEQRVELRGIIINIDEPEAANMNINSLRAREGEFDELYNVYLAASSGTDAQENELMKKVLDIYNGQYKTLKEQMVTAFQAGDKAATRRYFDQTGVVAEQATEALYEMVQYGGERAAAINEQDQRVAFMLMAVAASLTVLLVVLAVALGLFNAKLIAKPLSHMADAAQALSAGDVSVNVSANSNDEIGILAKSFEQMIAGIQEQAELLEAIAQGDYTVNIRVRSDKDVINQAIQDLLSNSGHMMAEIKTASGQLTSASGQIAQGAQELASGSSEQAASIQQFTATLTELHEKTNLNAQNSAKAREANEKAVVQLDDSMKSMGDMLAAMKAIDESSSNITKVIKVIDDIAFQTNILALNAAVEAARAGQHGKGFAVVANEVGNLASKSAAAAKETAALIEGSSERVREGNQIVTKTSASLEAVVEHAQELARLVAEVATASTEQKRSIEEINIGIEQISTVVQANSATAQQSAAAAQQMSSQAVMFNEIVARFKLKQEDPRLANAGRIADSRVHKSEEQSDTAGFAPSYGKY